MEYISIMDSPPLIILIVLHIDPSSGQIESFRKLAFLRRFTVCIEFRRCCQFEFVFHRVNQIQIVGTLGSQIWECSITTTGTCSPDIFRCCLVAVVSEYPVLGCWDEPHWKLIFDDFVVHSMNFSVFRQQNT